MPKCCSINLNLFSVNSFFIHLKLFHFSLPIYKCLEVKCHRQFNKLNSFRKHYSNSHIDFDECSIHSNAPLIIISPEILLYLIILSIKTLNQHLLLL